MAAASAATEAAEQKEAEATPPQPSEEGMPRGKAPKAARRRDSVFEAMAKSAARSVGSQLGRQIVRGVLGGIFGGRR